MINRAIQTLSRTLPPPGSTLSREAIRELAAQPPPNTKASSWRFTDALAAHAEIRNLEELLGLEPGAPITGIGRANARVSQLQDLLVRSRPALETNITPAVPAIAPARMKPKAFGLAELKALHSLVFGEAETASLLQNRADWQYGKEEMIAADAAVESARQFGMHSPALAQAGKARAELRQQLEKQKAGSDADKFARLAKSFATHGLSLPGVSFASLGIDAKIHQRGGSDTLPFGVRKHAEQTIAEFSAVISREIPLSAASRIVAQAFAKIPELNHYL